MALPHQGVFVRPENQLLRLLQFVVNEKVLHARSIQNGCMNIWRNIEFRSSFKLSHNLREQRSVRLQCNRIVPKKVLKPDDVSAVAPDLAKAKSCDAVVLAKIPAGIGFQQVDPGRPSVHFFRAQERSRMITSLSKRLVRVEGENINHHQDQDERLNDGRGKLLRQDQKKEAKREEEKDRKQ